MLVEKRKSGHTIAGGDEMHSSAKEDSRGAKEPAHCAGSDRGFPDVAAPAVHGIYGQPDSAWEMVNRYGTYEIQPTCDTDNLYPMIMQGLPRQWESALERKRSAWKQTPPMQ